MTIRIEKSVYVPHLFFLREEGEEHPYGYIRRIGNKWWAAIPGGDVCGYFPTRSEAIAVLI